MNTMTTGTKEATSTLGSLITTLPASMSLGKIPDDMNPFHVSRELPEAQERATINHKISFTSLRDELPQRTDESQSMWDYWKSLTSQEQQAYKQVKKLITEYQSVYKDHSGFSTGEMECENHMRYLTQPNAKWDLVIMRSEQGNVVGGIHINNVPAGITAGSEKTTHIEQFWADERLTKREQKNALTQIFDKIQSIVDTEDCPVTIEGKHRQLRLLPPSAKVFNMNIEQAPFKEGDPAIPLFYGIVTPSGQGSNTLDASRVQNFIETYQSDWSNDTAEGPRTIARMRAQTESAPNGKIQLLQPTEAAKALAYCVDIRSMADTLTGPEKEAINAILEKDPYLRDGRTKYAIDRMDLSKNAKSFMREFASMRRVYEARFPDPSETETATALFGYLTDPEMNWTAITLKLDGIAAAIATGQTATELKGSKQFGDVSVPVIWNEHNATLITYARQGLGSKAYSMLERHLDQGIIVAELDRPNYNLDPTSSPAAFNHANPSKREQAWLNEEHAMDPFGRLSYWAKHGYSVAIVKNKTTGEFEPLGYIQISMTPKEFLSECSTLVLGIKLNRDDVIQSAIEAKERVIRRMGVLPCAPEEITGVLDKDDSAIFMGNMQATIDKNQAWYPESRRRAKIHENQQGPVFLVRADSEFVRDMLSKKTDRNPVADLVEDLKYEHAMITGAESRGPLSAQMVRDFMTRTLLDLEDQRKSLEIPSDTFWKNISAQTNISAARLIRASEGAEEKGREFR